MSEKRGPSPGAEAAENKDRMTSATEDSNPGSTKPVKAKREFFNPVDKGWSWVILTSVCLVNFITRGFLRSFGVLFVPIQEAFHAEASEVSLVNAIAASVFSCLAVVTMTFGLAKMSVRTLVRVGALLLVVGTSCCFLADSMVYLYISYAALYGLGLAMCRGPGFVLLGQYFDRRRALALAVANTGDSMGMLVIPYMVKTFLDEYSLAGTFLLAGGFLAQTLVLASFLTPPADYRPRKNVPGDEADDGVALALLKEEEEEEVFLSLQNGDAPENQKEFNVLYHASLPESRGSQNMDTPENHGSLNMDTLENHGSQNVVYNVDTSENRGSPNMDTPENHGTPNMDTPENHGSQSMDTPENHGSQNMDTPENHGSQNVVYNMDTSGDPGSQYMDTPENDRSQHVLYNDEDCRHGLLDPDRRKPDGDEHPKEDLGRIVKDNPQLVSKDPEIGFVHFRSRTNSESDKRYLTHLNGALYKSHQRPNLRRALSDGTRTDGFTISHTKTTTKHACHVSAEVYVSSEMAFVPPLDSTTSPPSYDQESLAETGNMCCQGRSSCFDPSLLKSFMLWLLLAHALVAAVGSSIPVIFLPPLAIEKGLTMSDSALLLTVVGALDIVSRLVPGFVAQLKWLKPQTMVIITSIVLAMVCQFTAFYNSLGALMGMTILVGLCGGVYVSMVQLIVIDFVGMTHFPRVFGMVQMVLGLGAALGNVVIGFLRDISGTYVIPYHAIGACVFLSAGLLLLEPLVRHLDSRMAS